MPLSNRTVIFSFSRKEDFEDKGVVVLTYYFYSDYTYSTDRWSGTVPAEWKLENGSFWFRHDSGFWNRDDDNGYVTFYETVKKLLDDYVDKTLLNG